MTKNTAPEPERNVLGVQVVENVRHLMELHEWDHNKTSGHAGIAEATLRKMLASPETANVTLRILEALATAMGVEPHWLLMEQRDMLTTIAQEGFRPFMDARPDSTRVSSALAGSGQQTGAARTHYRRTSKKPAASRKTSPASASNRRYAHNASDQQEQVRAWGEVYVQRTEEAHALRPARTPVRVPETLIPSTKAA